MSTVSLRDVALAAGVSKSSAQRALAGDPRCKGKTRVHVQRIALQMGYRPNPIFSIMGSRNKHKRLHQVPLAYVRWTGDTEHGSDDIYFTPSALRAEELGYILQPFNIKEFQRPGHIWKILYARGVAGVLLSHIPSDALPLLLQNDRFPAVCCGRWNQLPFHTVRPGILMATQRLWSKVVSYGYQKIGVAVCCHTHPLEDDFCRHAAILACQQKEGLTGRRAIPPFTRLLSDLTAFLAWVKKYSPDVVIGFNLSHYQTLVEAGYRIPDDIGYASLHVNSSEMPHQLWSLDQQYNTIGECAVNLLDQLIRSGERGRPAVPLDILVEPSLVEGASLRQVS